MIEIKINKMAYTAKDPRPPPRRFLYLTETKSWKSEEREREAEGEGERGGENVSLKTHATARGVGKKGQRKIKRRRTSPGLVSVLYKFAVALMVLGLASTQSPGSINDQIWRKVLFIK